MHSLDKLHKLLRICGLVTGNQLEAKTRHKQHRTRVPPQSYHSGGGIKNSLGDFAEVGQNLAQVERSKVSRLGGIQGYDWSTSPVPPSYRYVHT